MITPIVVALYLLFALLSIRFPPLYLPTIIGLVSVKLGALYIFGVHID